ncbi:DinB family protein [Aquimarina sp. AU474]|uniref:DinB family protein n=1 Tax=Aquimarina sp. AU474 TaxID=2108529 RepID=UPI000D68D7AC|nr:DinB family protein [Aquimarina sp. AU474]
MNRTITYPSKNEYPEYAEMYMNYVKKDGSLIEQLNTTLTTTIEFIKSLTQKELDIRYATNKWSVKEVLVHVIDDERIYAYRALTFARNDQTQLPGFEEEHYIKHADIAARPVTSIIEEYRAVRLATIALFNGLSNEALSRIGTANHNKTSVRALGYHILGHELHHISVIKEKYFRAL